MGAHRYHYVDEGRGDPVVMVHGNPTWSFYYRRLISALRSDYRTIAPDHIGCGLSDKPTDSSYNYTLKQRVDDLEALLDHLGIDKKITLVLHDWGGMIGMAYAARQPERIARLVILNTAAFLLPQTKRFPLALTLCRGPVGAFLVRGLNLFCRGAASVGTKRSPLTQGARQGYLSPYDSWRHRIAVHRFVQDIPLREGDRAYAEVMAVERSLDRFADVPMQLFWGEKDFVFDRHFLAEWQRRFPAAEVHSFADAGHYVLEDAFDEILPRVQDFLRRHPIR
ncbi:MAG: alpha/beta fold hydrolase [Planctomycetota bacterium]